MFTDSKPPLPFSPQSKSSKPPPPSPRDRERREPDYEKRQQKRALPQELLTHKSETVICLKNQNLTKISQRDIDKYRKYLGFDVSFNRIYFSDDLCREFRFIRFLNISHNHIEKLPHDIHHMENLTIFNVSFNKIVKLPLNLYKMTKLNWMDARGNPFLDNWNKNRQESELNSNTDIFDPRKFVFEIRPYMLAVKDWRDINIRKRAEEILEYLVICPVRPPCPEDAEFDLTIEDYSDCPFNKLMQTHPEEIQKILDLTDKNRPSCVSYPEDYVGRGWKKHSKTILKLIFLKGTMLLMTLLSLAIAFMEPKQFDILLEYLFSPAKDSFIANTFKTVHSTGQSLTPLFPIREPWGKN